MRRLRNDSDERFEANVWPAVTDSVLLIASVFIVLSVVTMVFFVARLRGGPKDGDGNETPLLCVSYSINESLLFPTSEHRFLKEADAEKAVKDVLQDVPAEIQRLKKYAESQNWNASGYYIVIEAAGHADFRPWPKSTPYQNSDGNWTLSTDRADSIVYLMQHLLAKDDDLRKKLGIPADAGSPYHEAPFGSTILRTAGYSSQAPAVAYTDNLKQASAADRPALEQAIADKNRRVEIRVYAQPAEIIRTTMKLSK